VEGAGRARHLRYFCPGGGRARLSSSLARESRDKKIVIEKVRHRKNMRRRNGHRQYYLPVGRTFTRELEHDGEAYQVVQMVTIATGEIHLWST
jgi:hypothetical protein